MDEFDQWWDANSAPTEPMTEDQRWHIADLMERVTLMDREIDGIKLMLYNGPTYSEANQLIAELYSRLPDPVTERGRYNQKDLVKHINKII